MNRCVLVLGGEIKSYEKAGKLLRADDWFLFCDCGLIHCEKLGVEPDAAIGDFDSHLPPAGVETIILPREKDDTDSYAGVKEALKRGYRDFLILGALGGRTDHELANIYLLDYLFLNGSTGVISDGNTTLTLVGKDGVKIRKGGKYFSLLALWGKAEGVSIKGAAYNLTDAVIEPQYQYGVSNEVRDDEAEVRVRNGKLLLVEIEEEL